MSDATLELGATEKHAGGRPTDYGPDIVSTICERIADGQSVREIARDDAMPAMSTIFKWLSIHPEFAEQYVRAKEAQAEHFAEDILDIADNANNDWMERLSDEDKSLGWRENGEAIQRSRLRVDSRKWLLSKLMPKKYGDKITHAGDAENPLVVRHEDALKALE